MKLKHNLNKKLIKFFNGRAFYVVLCLCFVAVGVAMWSGIEVLKENNDNKSNNTTTETPDTSVPNITIKLPEDSTSSVDSSKPSSKPQQTTDSKPSEEASASVASFFVRPILGELLKGYSDTELQYSLTFKDMRLHKAIDIAGKYGDPVIASGKGIVTDVYTDAMLGTVVEIDHGNGITAKYCGLNSEPSVKKGDTVDSSVQLGSLGDIPSESVEEVHLHLEFYKNGKSTDPLKFFTAK